MIRLTRVYVGGTTAEIWIDVNSIVSLTAVIDGFGETALVLTAGPEVRVSQPLDDILQMMMPADSDYEQ